MEIKSIFAQENKLQSKNSDQFISIVNLGEIGSCRNTDSLRKLGCWKDSVENLKRALLKTGFVYLTNHGIQQHLVQSGFSESENFFNLPLDSKMKYERDFEHTFHGYTPPGRKVISAKNKEILRELRESFDCNIFSDEKECPYPAEECPAFQPTMKNLTNECKLLGIKLLTMMADVLLLENPNFFLDHHQCLFKDNVPNYTSLRTLHYPKIDEGIQPGTVRFDEHTDYGTITLLFQDSIGGLEVKNKYGQWMPATYIPNSILINTGDLLNTWSGGILPSTLHRVIVPQEEVKLKTKRQSIAFFIKPDNSSVVTPIADNSIQQSKIQFSHVNAGEHFRRRTLATRFRS